MSPEALQHFSHQVEKGKPVKETGEQPPGGGKPEGECYGKLKVAERSSGLIKCICWFGGH